MVGVASILEPTEETKGVANASEETEMIKSGAGLESLSAGAKVSVVPYFLAAIRVSRSSNRGSSRKGSNRGSTRKNIFSQPRF